MNLKRFNIGDSVEVVAVIESHRDDKGNKVLERRALPVKKKGQITGLKKLFHGTYLPGYQPSGSFLAEDPPDYEPACFQATGSETLWAVRFGKLNKEVYVRNEDVLTTDLYAVHTRINPNCKLAKTLRSSGHIAQMHDYYEFNLRDGNVFVPVVDQQVYQWTEKDKKELGDIMKDHPRDSKGRWVKNANDHVK